MNRRAVLIIQDFFVSRFSRFLNVVHTCPRNEGALSQFVNFDRGRNIRSSAYEHSHVWKGKIKPGKSVQTNKNAPKQKIWKIGTKCSSIERPMIRLRQHIYTALCQAGHVYTKLSKRYIYKCLYTKRKKIKTKYQRKQWVSCSHVSLCAGCVQTGLATFPPRVYFSDGVCAVAFACRDGWLCFSSLDWECSLSLQGLDSPSVRVVYTILLHHPQSLSPVRMAENRSLSYFFDSWKPITTYHPCR